MLARRPRESWQLSLAGPLRRRGCGPVDLIVVHVAPVLLGAGVQLLAGADAMPVLLERVPVSGTGAIINLVFQPVRLLPGKGQSVMSLDKNGTGQTGVCTNSETKPVKASDRFLQRNRSGRQPYRRFHLSKS